MILLTPMGYPVVIRPQSFIEDPIEREERYRCLRARVEELCSELRHDLSNQRGVAGSDAIALDDGICR